MDKEVLFTKWFNDIDKTIVFQINSKVFGCFQSVFKRLLDTIVVKLKLTLLAVLKRVLN